MPRAGGDHRGAAFAPVHLKQPSDLRCQAARRAARGGNVPARAWLAHLQPQDGDTPSARQATRCGMRWTSPRGGDEGSHRYSPIPSITQRVTPRLRTSRPIASSAFSRRSRGASSARSSSPSTPVPTPRRRLPAFTQLPRMPLVAAHAPGPPARSACQSPGPAAPRPPGNQRRTSCVSLPSETSLHPGCRITDTPLALLWVPAPRHSAA
jgi:hypothetical protein